jgi:hypothetical protein
VPLVDLAQLQDYWYTPQVVVYLPGSQDASLNCHCELELQIAAIKEPDPTVDLEGRWFVDYDVNNLQQGPVETPLFLGSFNQTNDVRGPVTYAFNPDALKLSAGTHSIEFVIAERQGYVANITVRPHHRALNPGWDASVLKLVVEVRSLVPGSPPSTYQLCDQNPDVIKPLTQRVCPP